jgi:hypothetical protein
MTPDDPVAVVQRQLEAYNARDLDAFAANYAETIVIYRMPASQPTFAGKEKLREVYRQRFASPQLHAEILSRVVLGTKVIDHERIVGIRDTPVEALAIYEVRAGLIQSVWFFYPEAPP